DLPIDGAYVTALALLAQIAWYLGDEPRAARLYELLEPFAGQNIAIGSAAVFYGPVSRYLGLLASTLSRWEEAARRFDDALKMTAEMRARPFEAYVQVEYGAMLMTRDREKGAVLVNQGLANATELGMSKLVQDATAALSGAGVEARQD